MTTSPAKQYLSPAEFADLSGLSLSSVHRRIADRSLPFIQPGGKRKAIRIPRTALEALQPTRAVPDSEPADSSVSAKTKPRHQPHWQREF